MPARNVILIGLGIALAALIAVIAWVLLASAFDGIQVRVFAPVIITRQVQISPDAFNASLQDALSVPMQAFTTAVDELAQAIIEAFDLPSSP